jgi:hypothetical protein
MWPTPNAMDAMGPRSDEAYARAKKKGGCSNLKDVVPRMLPTPAASQGHKKVRPLAPSEGNGTHGTMLVGAVGDQDPSTIGSYLNPNWVEALMGFPVGWTEEK